MDYTVNPNCFSSVFVVPCSAVDNNIVLASELQTKVLLCAMRGLSNGVNPDQIAAMLSVPVSQVEDALLYWCKAGVFASKEAAAVTQVKPIEPVITKSAKPTRADVAERGLQDPKVRFLMQEAQRYFGHSLKSTESTTLLWLYDDQGMDISVIMMLLQYALSENKLNIRFIEKTALCWIENGVQTVLDAEKQIAAAARCKTAWHIVQKAFGIESRQPSAKELSLSDLWLNEWQLSTEMLKCAYDICIDTKSKFAMPYVAKILENWHKEGYKTPDDIKKSQETRKPSSSSSFAAYDIDAFEKMLNSNDN